jgi:transcriptional regulator with XRE-family HTH domain
MDDDYVEGEVIGEDPFTWLFEKNHLGKLITICLERANWSQTRLAEVMGTPQAQAQISRIVRGLQRPHDDTLMRMADAFRSAGVPVTYEQFQAARDGDIGDELVELDARMRRLLARLRTYPPHVQDQFIDTLYHTFALLEAAFWAQRRDNDEV